MRTVIFDLDGTLADTSADLISAANLAFQRHGHQPPLLPKEDYHLAHKGGRAMIKAGMDRLGLSDAQWGENAYQEFIWCYATDLSSRTLLYDGVLDCLEQLKQRGHRLGICTNKPYSLARDLVAELGIAEYFDALLGADSLSVRKPNPAHLFGTIDAMGKDRKNAVLIGDTITDAKTAQAADIPAILVLFGPHGEEVRKLPAADYIAHYDALIPALERLG